MLGAGAVINGACSTGTIARIGSGEFAYGLTIAGFFVGCLMAPHLFGRLASDHPRTAPPFTLERSVLFVALLSGAIVAGRSLRGTRLVGPLKPRAIRCTVGGLIMGIGFSIAPGAFEGDTLLGQPLLLAYAWTTMGASYLAIILGLLVLRSRVGGRIAALRPDPPAAGSPRSPTWGATTPQSGRWRGSPSHWPAKSPRSAFTSRWWSRAASPPTGSAQPRSRLRWILTIADADEPPLRVFLGANVFALARADYQSRLAQWEQWESVAHEAHDSGV